jgi:hypothetical protein
MSNQHYRNAPPPGGNKRSKSRAVLSRLLRSGFNIAGSRQTDLDENAEQAEIFVLSGIIITIVTIGIIWLGLWLYF